MLRLVCAFLLSLIVGSPVYAATIIDVEEIMTVIAREDISDCEWIEKSEIRTVTTYRESTLTYITVGVPGITHDIEFLTSSLYNNQLGAGVGNGPQSSHPCFPESDGENSKIPDNCKASLTLVGLGYTLTTPLQDFREWSEVSIAYVLHHYNTCQTCNHDPVPEPASLILFATGLAMVFFFVWKRQVKS